MGFFKVNNNQSINLTQNQIMQCIVCHNNVVGHETFALCTRLQKGFIIDHKSIDIAITKKHVELNTTP